MKAVLILDDQLTQRTINRVNSNDLDSIIILANKDLYYKFKKVSPRYNYVLIDLFADNFEEEKVKLTEEIIKDLLQINPRLIWNEYSLPELTVNLVFDNLVGILYNFITGLDSIIKKYNITQLTLYEGNPHVQFVAMALAEGERLFRFLYKRCWFLNYFANQAFKDKINIVWKDKTLSVYLKTINFLRPMIILGGKILLIFKRIIRNKKDKNYVEINPNNKPYALLIVRNPVQVDPLIPIYNEFKRRREYTPVYLTFENYSNNKLISNLRKRKLLYFDLYNKLTLKTLWKVLCDIKNIIKKPTNIKLNRAIEGNKINLSYERLINNLSIYWIDILILKELLDKFEEENKNINCLINNETHGYHSAIEAEWARKRGLPSIGIQHVSIGERFKPKISRVDTMFMMSKDITNKLSALKSDEKFIFVGPVAYDMYFNTTKHKNEFNVITIFTQPDDFKKEYFQIIDDVIYIISKNNMNLDINVKLHPREKDVESFKKYKHKYKKLKVITDEINSSDLVALSDISISISSGVLMQSILIGTPVISINYDKKYNINLDFINDDVTKKISTKKELEDCFMNLRKFNNEYFKNRDYYIKNKLNDYDGNAAIKVYEYIQKRLTNM